VGRDANNRGGQKPVSTSSRVVDLEQQVVWIFASMRVLCETLLVEPEPLRRAKILALLATMSDTGRGARVQSDGQQT